MNSLKQLCNVGLGRAHPEKLCSSILDPWKGQHLLVLYMVIMNPSVCQAGTTLRDGRSTGTKADKHNNEQISENLCPHRAVS